MVSKVCASAPWREASSEGRRGILHQLKNFHNFNFNSMSLFVRSWVLGSSCEKIQVLLSIEPWTAAEKKLYVSVARRCHQLLYELLANGHLPRVSRRSANDKGDNDMKPEAGH